jgi:hypothetical protein
LSATRQTAIAHQHKKEGAGRDYFAKTTRALQSTKAEEALREDNTALETTFSENVAAASHRERYEFVGAESSLICCKLSMLLDTDDMVAVSVNVDKRGQQASYAQYGSSHGNYQRSKHRMDIRVNVADLLVEYDVDVLADPHANVRPLQ